MNDLYTKGYKNDTIQIIMDQLHDLELWSVNNNDEHSEDIQNLKALLNKIRGNG